ncbi:SDR family oxidoreductase [Haloarcula argentinensis]|uniref:SDR family oxidoreductase n=1 Tax=Haloarcula argentinensis TaxID=43776 RepID=A0A830FTN1_HALAR|nr:SDR family oxidoreductase [Haloarcula argentinensis]EMA20728.1 oxidoreductase [Haloarcula argentinensis DSM 12282]MDS0255070.1 SDR family oxidoreductase [Haloarcula argentinensis]GGM36799.1 short-chain dehydrogenase/reductase [Haloarcula argentinensis]
MSTGDSVVLLTGAASGIGAATARAFADNGWTVYATDIESEFPDDIGERCRCLELDVTDDAQIAAVVDQIVAETGRLDGLVNNAGYGVAGPVEDVSIDATREQFDVLVHGPHRLAQAVLPELREHGGRIITVSSVLGHTASPGLGAYSAGKAAVESLTDALRIEVAGADDVHVSLVEPAWVETGFADGALGSLPDEDRTPTYDRTYDALEDGWVLTGGPLTTTPEAVAARVLAAATDTQPKARYPVGAFATFVRWTHWLPARLQDPIHRGFGRASAFLGRWLR